MKAAVWHYDGVSAVRRTPSLIAGDDGFTLIEGDWRDGPIAWDALVARGDGGEPVYGLKDRHGWRLGFVGSVPAEIVAKLPRPERYGRWVDRHGIAKAAAAFAVIAAVVVFVFMSAPGWIAPYVPASWERRLGDAIVGDFGGRLCDGKGGQAALDALTRELNPQGLPIEARVANIDMVNAVALPGGKIVIFEQLLEEARSPDEVAGVLGHEIGHVGNRDVVQALLRQAGLSVLLGGFSGDAGGALNAVVAATYSREAEARADGWAIRSLKRAGISPAGTADFFRRLAAMETKMGRASVALSYVASHPLSTNRERAFTASAVKGHAYRPALTDQQWKALTAICRNDPKVKKGWFFPQ